MDPDAPAGLRERGSDTETSETAADYLGVTTGHVQPPN
jgi:hypothetical protein